MKALEIAINENKGVKLTAYLQEVGKEFRSIKKRPAVLVLPGGGYQYCSDREGDPIALPYLAAGYDVFVLRYSVSENFEWPSPLNDYEDAMEYIQTHADEWHVMKDKIAVAGFSAGGHLAGAAATIARHKPAAAILGYAALNDMIGEIAPGAPDITKLIDYNTCPCFLFSSRSDNVVPIESTLAMMQALDQAGTTFECHIYPYGPHGFSTGISSVQNKDGAFCPRIPNWMADSIGFLKDVLGEFYVGDLENKILEEPACKTHITEDKSGHLSLDCTIGLIFGNPVAKAAIEETIEKMKQQLIPFTPRMTFEDMIRVLSKMKLRDVLNERNVDYDEVAVNEALKKIKNNSIK